MNAALDDLVEVSDKNWTLSNDFSGWSPGGGIRVNVTAWELAEPISALTARARYRHAGQNDIAGAMSDLLAALRLRGWRDRRTAWVPTVNSLEVLNELCFAALENDVSRGESAGVIAYILNKLPRSLSEGMLTGVGLEGDVAQTLDRYYTDDGNGDGWLAVSVLGEGFAAPGMASGRRSRLWNVLSPLFNGRANVSRKFERYHREFGRIDTLSYAAGLAEFKRLQSRRLFNVTDGPFVQIASAMNEWTYRMVVVDLLKRRAAIIALALSAHKNDHGEYPTSLNQLTPAYLDRVPIDVLTAKPFEYQQDGDGYSLNEGQTLPEEMAWNYRWGISTQPTGPQPIYARSRPPPALEPASGGGK